MRIVAAILTGVGVLLAGNLPWGVLAARNFLVWRNSEMKVWDPEMGGRDGMFSPVRTIEFAVPPPHALSVSVRASYR